LGASVNGERGTTLSTRDHAIWPNSRFPDAVHIFSDKHKFAVEHDPDSITFGEEAAEPDIPWEFGLLWSKKRSLGTQDVYFARPSASLCGFVTYCNMQDKSCTSHYRISQENLVSYTFNFRHLQDWKEMRRGVESLVRQWIVKIDPK
jgi:hypothetical protein